MHWSELDVWKESHKLTLDLYKITLKFPDIERYGVADQIRRASSSVAANIVEGQSKKSTKDYIKYLYNSRGSIEETRYFLMLSRDLGYIMPDEYKGLEQRCEKISKMLNGLIRSLGKRD